MARKRQTPEQVINKLREAEVAIAGGSTVAEAARRIGVTEQTFYRWRSEYGGLRIDQARRLGCSPDLGLSGEAGGRFQCNFPEVA